MGQAWPHLGVAAVLCDAATHLFVLGNRPSDAPYSVGPSEFSWATCFGGGGGSGALSETGGSLLDWALTCPRVLGSLIVRTGVAGVSSLTLRPFVLVRHPDRNGSLDRQV